MSDTAVGRLREVHKRELEASYLKWNAEEREEMMKKLKSIDEDDTGAIEGGE